MGIKASALDKMQIADDLGISNADGMAGACFEMGLLDAWEEGGDVLIIPSDLGLKFMCMTNPVLEHIYHNKELPEKFFSEEERTLFLTKILPHFKLEKEIVDAFFKAEEGKMEFLQSKFNENQATYFEKFWKDKVWSKFRVKIISLFTESRFKMITDNESSDSKNAEEKRTEEIVQETIKYYWETAKTYQRVHLVVILSRLAELGYCRKSEKRPFTYSFYN